MGGGSVIRPCGRSQTVLLLTSNQSTNQMTNLSPAAQAVLDAAINVAESPDAEAIAAAVLRAVVDDLSYLTQLDDPMMSTVNVVDVDDILAIAAELEAA